MSPCRWICYILLLLSLFFSCLLYFNYPATFDFFHTVHYIVIFRFDHCFPVAGGFRHSSVYERLYYIEYALHISDVFAVCMHCTVYGSAVFMLYYITVSVLKDATAYSTLPNSRASKTLPAVLIMKKSPISVLKILFRRYARI